MAYLYRHIRLDENIPFYIGIGNDKNYRRAYTSYSRNRHWHNIVNKTAYEVEIMMDDIPHDLAKIKEIEFIKFYGRSDLGLGKLVNYTDGGDGNTNWCPEKRKKFSDSQKGKKVSEETRKKSSESHKGHKPSLGTLQKLSYLAKNRVITKETREKMASKLRGRPQPQWQRDILSKAAKGKKVWWCYKPIEQYSIDGMFIKRYESISAAVIELGFQDANIWQVLNGKRKHTGCFVFRYEGDRFDKFKVNTEVGGMYNLKKVINTKTGVIYDSTRIASEAENIKLSKLKNILGGVQKNNTNLIYL